ncbi:MAG: discoidin domain-containing protein [Anaerolineae bacterium]|nr:discoidin domain-containing protein [Anaerolineae bacterium]
MSFRMRRFSYLLVVVGVIAALVFFLVTRPSPTHAEYVPGIPAAVDPGTPSFSGSSNPIPAVPASYSPGSSMMEAIFNADVAAGGTSYWVDRILARPYLSADYHDFLFTRGRALYMYTYSPGTLGFGGGYAYRERPTGSSQNLFTISVSGTGLSETLSQRVQYPSHASSLFTRSGLSVLQKKFITHNNVAIAVLTITNTGSSSTSVTVTANSPIATSASGSELTGTVNLRYGLSTIYPRFSGDGFSVSGSSLTRSINLASGQAITLKLQLGALANEIPESTTDYNRYRGYDANTAFLTHLREYNRWWVDNAPYVDLPNKNIEKMVYYRMFLNRFNYFDGNIPGSDYQFPVSIEGVTGYNNAIQLTQPMHMQDLKYFRNPVYSYGNWLSSGENSKYGPFTDNPGGSSWGVGNPYGTYEQYIGFEAFESYKVHGGEAALLNNLARYAEGDATGYLAKYDQNNNYLISYRYGADTGNDADAVALVYYNREQERTESAFWYAGAKASAEAYALLGNSSKANAMTTLSNNIRNAVLANLWDSAPASSGGHVFKQKDILTGNLVPWKDQQNWVPFSFGLVPNTADYREALRFYADKAQMPIMPSYTANQYDKALAVAAGKGGSNNYSNINSTLHAQLFSAALRNYPSSYVTADSYRKLIEWQTWTEYINGDNRLPDNNEFWADYNPSTGTMYRSWIHHNILGAYNFMIIEDVAGVRPRADNIVELWPIDMGYDHFTVNNLSYHGQDYTLVWDRPGGTDYYSSAPDGYSLYLDGQRKFTVSDLTHLTWNPSNGQVTILGTSATVSYNTTGSLPAAIDVSLSENDRMVEVAEKAGVDLSTETGGLPNLAQGKTATASYSASNMNPAYAVDGFTVSGIPVTVGSWVGRNPIWGTEGSSSTQYWLQVDLGSTMTFDTVKLYFHDNKSWPIGGNTYRQPSSYTVQYNNGSNWVDVPSQIKTPSTPWPNYNKVTFPAVSARLVRVLMNRSGSYAIGVKEIQIFNTGGQIITPTPTGTPTKTPTPTATQPPSDDPVVWYRFDESSGTTAADSSGNGLNASLVNGPTWVSGQSGNAVNLDGSNDYVSMPSGVISSLDDFTIATWVRLDSASTWSRVFDFGTGTSVNMFLTPTSGSGVRFAITTGGSGGEQRISGSSALPTGSWTHVAVTLSDNTGILYVNGTPVGQNTSMTLSPSSLGSTNQNWIGRSQYSSDAYLDGIVDDFRIYNRGLSASEVQALAITGPTPTLTITGTPTRTPTPSMTPTASNTPTATATGSVTPPSQLAWYQFDESSGTTAVDASGNGLNATLVNGPTWVSGRVGNAVNLDGSNDYVSMPSGILSSLNDFTIATWVKLDTTGSWRRLFDFGTGTSANMFLVPQSGSGAIRFAITTGGWSAEQQINGSSALPTGSWVHVAVTLSGSTGRLYVDGVQVGQNTSMTLRPSSLGSTGNNWLGRSQYSGDAYLDGQIDQFMIYNRALSASEVLALYQNP